MYHSARMAPVARADDSGLNILHPYLYGGGRWMFCQPKRASQFSLSVSQHGLSTPFDPVAYPRQAVFPSFRNSSRILTWTNSDRPLNPPPIVQLDFPPAINNGYLFCNVDLFRIPDSPPPDISGGHTDWTYYSKQGNDATGTPFVVLLHTHRPQWDHVLTPVGNHLLLEAAAETHLLLGPRSVQAHSMNDGKTVFVFPNLAVLQSGSFVMRYTASVLHLNGAGGPQRVAQCFGPVFSVVNSAQYPGHGPTTTLTRSLAPLNIQGLRNR
ncbi:hypothetical protein C8R44DRAFT_417137 [Mycena epipterygia]|nr:hypothetical protein C8R44DRAFT_417137 [Mycena epipterygia]